MNYIKQNLLSLIVIVFLVGFLIIGSLKSEPAPLGNAYDRTTITNPVTHSQDVTFSESATIGTSGSTINQLNFGSCNLQPDAATIAASSTARVTCHGGSWAAGQAAFTALTGITSTSKIVASLSSTTAGSTFEGLVLTGVTASTTAGFIEMRISNQTGTTYTWPVTGSASGTAQYIGIK